VRAKPKAIGTQIEDKILPRVDKDFVQRLGREYMWKLKEYSLLFLTVVAPAIFAGQCSISILNERNSGEKIRIHFISKLFSQEQCRALARMHQSNFNPDEIKSKKVSFQWSNGQQSPMKIRAPLKRAHLTQVKKTKSKKLPKF
jgi:hypothetical protein